MQLYTCVSFAGRYQAAMILKRSCLQHCALGDILQVLHIIVVRKKWIVPHSSGWQPLSINTTADMANTDATGKVKSWFVSYAHVGWIFWCAGEWQIENVFEIHIYLEVFGMLHYDLCSSHQIPPDHQSGLELDQACVPRRAVHSLLVLPPNNTEQPRVPCSV